MIIPGKYTHVWQKYRPVILNLMVKSSDGPKEYQLYNHEFHDLNNKTASGYSFTLRMHKGKKVNDTKKSVLAQDLLNVLQNSEKAQQLGESALYEFQLDKNFILHIKREQVEESDEG